MKPKWYLNTFILIIAFLGAVLQQFSVPNQEIVLQFEGQEISLGETENAIADVAITTDKPMAAIAMWK